MDLTDSVMAYLRKKLKINSRNKEYSKFEETITVLNVAYLKLAADEIHAMLKRGTKVKSKYALLMSIYNKHIREHQVMFLLFSIFENALRSKASVTLSQKFSTHDTDDWWQDVTTMDKDLIKPISGALFKLHKQIPSTNTYELFDTFTLGQLQHIYKNYWSDFLHNFTTKPYRTHTIPQINQKSFYQKLDFIRMARNDISHHKPINYSRRSRKDLIRDCELLLCHLDFNLEAAVNGIDPGHSIIRLQYI